MRKITYVLVSLGILIAPIVKADNQVFGFMDGKLYNASGVLRYACLTDGNCYDYDTKQMTTLGAILGLSTSTPSTITVSTGVDRCNNIEGVQTLVPDGLVSLNGACITPTVPLPTPSPSPLIVDAPVAQISAPVVDTTLPAYDEQGLLNLVGKTVHLASGQAYKVFPCVPGNITSTSVIFSCDGSYDNYKKLNIVLNGQTVISNGQGQTPDGLRDWVQVNNLTPHTTYNYNLVYSETGRQDTTIVKSFSTP